MRSVSSSTAGWLRLCLVGGFAAALALAAGIAFAAPQGGASQVSTSVPDLTSFTVVKNGTTTGGLAVAALCFDKAIDAKGLGPGTAIAITLYGYGANKLSLAGASAASIPGNGSCASITIPPVGGVGVDLDGFTVAAVTQGAVRDAVGRASVPGAVGVTVLGSPEIKPELGETTGPKLLAVGRGPGANQLTYVFNRLLDPHVGPPASYRYVTLPGPEVDGMAAVLTAANEVRVTFPGPVSNDVQYSVAAGTVKTQTQLVPNPTGALGGPVVGRPTIRSAAAVSGAPGAFDVTYDLPVTLADPTKLVGYLEDNSTVPVTAAEITHPISKPDVVRVTFGASVSKYASLITKIVDTGGAVSGPNLSVRGEGDITTPPMRAGFTEGPDLISVALNPAAATASYTFDGNYGSLYTGVTAAAFHLVNSDGTLSAPATSASLTGSNTVTAVFGASQFASAVGGTISGSAAVFDYEAADCHGCAASINIVPVTAGGTTTTTTTTLPAGKVRAVRVGLRASGRRIAGGRTRVSFKGRIYLGNAFNPAFCFGKVNITLRHQSRKVATKRLSVGYRRCTFGQSITVRNSQLRNDGGRVYALFTGNRFVFPISSGAAVF
ncbi:MAG: hypothetical protein DLM64_13870 [Solirubrobacterales bacterium]|nr:MAG: hypothetical protein DLM64_13870 [Solirubrobacterales bacterium]